MKCIAIALLTLVTTTVGTEFWLHAQDPETSPISLRVRPRVAHSPATIRATAIVERDPRNRELTIVVESGDYYASSSQSLDGEQSARAHTRVFDDLPAGTYEIRATVRRNDRTTLVDLLTVTVMGQRKVTRAP